jgi:hypothetical protein
VTGLLSGEETFLRDLAPGTDSILIWVCDDLRALCFCTAAGLTTEFCEVDGARGCDAFRDVVVVADVTVLTVDGAFFTPFTSVFEFVRFRPARGAIFVKSREFA